jgi:XTP/dITP diphosphohydrolase
MTRSTRSLVLASGNAGKVRELSAMLEPLGYSVQPQSHWQVPEAIEDRASFIENALVKARNASAHCSLPAIADDSGLVVPALGGAPGIFSARFAGPGAGDQDNNAKLLRDMAGLAGAQRRAFFHCAIVMLSAPEDPVPLVASASWWGSILEAPRGTGGFGYDPLFFVADEGCTSAELGAARKNELSHRGQALQALLRQLKQHAPAPD